MSSAHRLLSIFATTTAWAIVAASPGCSSFGEATSGADAGNETSTEVTTDGSREASACETSCPPDASNCIGGVSEPGWTARSSGSSSGLSTMGEVVSSVPESGAALLDRTANLNATRGVVISLDITIDAPMKDGTTLAKIVAAGSEVNIRVDDGKLRACGTVGKESFACSSAAQTIAAGDRVRMSLRLERGNPLGSTPLSLNVGCGTTVATAVPQPGLDLTNVNVHIGIEGTGVARYHEIAIWQPAPP